jgi:hypothetical protein
MTLISNMYFYFSLRYSWHIVFPTFLSFSLTRGWKTRLGSLLFSLCHLSLPKCHCLNFTLTSNFISKSKRIISSLVSRCIMQKASLTCVDRLSILRSSHHTRTHLDKTKVCTSGQVFHVEPCYFLATKTCNNEILIKHLNSLSLANDKLPPFLHIFTV